MSNPVHVSTVAGTETVLIKILHDNVITSYAFSVEVVNRIQISYLNDYKHFLEHLRNIVDKEKEILMHLIENKNAKKINDFLSRLRFKANDKLKKFQNNLLETQSTGFSTVSATELDFRRELKNNPTNITEVLCFHF